MADQSKAVEIWRVIVSSPSDVAAEREAVTHAVDTINAGLEAEKRGFRLKLYKWETDVPAGPNVDGGQGRIEQHLDFAGADIVIGIFWKRFGTPTLGFGSGSEREIEIAHEAWTKKGKPAVMLFFNTAEYLCRTQDECEQLSKVIGFKQKWQARVLTAEYKGAADFERLATKNLLVECLGAQSATEALRLPYASEVSCTPVTIRIEGLAERVADVHLKFSSAPSITIGVPVQLTVDVKLSIDLAWPLDGGGPLLVVNAEGGPLVIHGTRLEPNSVRFADVPFTVDPMTITNIRVDAVALGVSATTIESPIAAYVEARTSAGGEIYGPATFVVARARLGMSFVPGHSIRKLSREEGVNAGRLGTRSPIELAPTLTLVFSEGFTGAFKTCSEEGGPTLYSFAPHSHFGTRLMATFQGIRNGVRIFVPLEVNDPASGKPILGLVQTAEDGLVQPYARRPVAVDQPQCNGVPLVPLELSWYLGDNSWSTAVAVWEWLGPPRAERDTPMTIMVDVALVAEPGEAGPGLIASVSGSLAPLVTPGIRPAFGSTIVPSFAFGSAHYSAFTFE